MATRIQPTPVLRGKDAERFLARVEEDLKRPLNVIKEPCLEAVKKMIFKNGKNRAKCCK